MLFRSQYMTKFSAPTALARSNPTIKVSYSSLLLVVGKSRRTMQLILSPSKLWSTTLAPLAYLLEDLSVWMLHCGTSSTPCPSTRVNSRMKSATTFPFISVHDRYCMLNSLNSTAHNAIRPTASRLLMALHRGLSVRTTTVCAWKYGLSFHAVVTNVKASFSIDGYFFSTPWNARLVKYTGFCTPSSSLTKVALIAVGEMARNRNSSSPSLDQFSNGGEERYVFRSSNACWHSVVHSNDFFNVQKKGRHLSVAFETNLFNAATLLFRLCTSLTIFGGANSIMACIFSRLTSIPLWDTMNPRNFLAVTLNTHLFGFSFMLYDRRVLKVS